MSRWLYKLNTLFDLRISHIKATYLIVADYLSRSERIEDSEYDYEPQEFVAKFVEAAYDAKEFTVETTAALQEEWQSELEADNDVSQYDDEYVTLLNNLQYVSAEERENINSKMIQNTANKLQTTANGVEEIVSVTSPFTKALEGIYETISEILIVLEHYNLSKCYNFKTASVA